MLMWCWMSSAATTKRTGEWRVRYQSVRWCNTPAIKRMRLASCSAGSGHSTAAWAAMRSQKPSLQAACSVASAPRIAR